MLNRTAALKEDLALKQIVKDNHQEKSKFNWREVLTDDRLIQPDLQVESQEGTVDIDLADINPGDGMIDSNGNPFGLLVPTNWVWPLERVNINTVYPYFNEYTQHLSGEIDVLSDQAKHWYN